jgi:hypothetical protein
MDKLIQSLPAILKAAGASPEVAEAACIAAWKQAVGEGLRSHAVPVQLQNQMLIVVVGDEIWKRQLEPMRSQLMFRLNSVLGQALVKSIELRVDPKRLAMAGRETNKSKDKDPGSARDYQVPFELLSAAAAIEDIELRRAFLGAATSCVRRLEEPESEPPA